MSPVTRVFWVRGEDGEDYGPVDLRELRSWVQENRVGLGTRVRRHEEASQWRSWQDFPELVALLAEMQAATPGGLPVGSLPAPLAGRLTASALDLGLCLVWAMPVISLLLLTVPPDTIVLLERVRLDPNLAREAMQAPGAVWYILTASLIFYATIALYFTGFQAVHGRTPGKSLLGLEVVDETGARPSLTRTALRSLIFSLTIYLITVVPFIIVVPILYTFFNPGRRTLHDLLAGTYVVRRTEASR